MTKFWFLTIVEKSSSAIRPIVHRWNEVVRAIPHANKNRALSQKVLISEIYSEQNFYCAYFWLKFFQWELHLFRWIFYRDKMTLSKINILKPFNSQADARPVSGRCNFDSVLHPLSLFRNSWQKMVIILKFVFLKNG